MTMFVRWCVARACVRPAVPCSCAGLEMWGCGGVWGGPGRQWLHAVAAPSAARMCLQACANEQASQAGSL